MTDVLKRLRGTCDYCLDECASCAVKMLDAANEIDSLTARLAAAEAVLRDSEARNCTSLEVIAAREQHIEAQRVEIERLLAVEDAYAASSADDANEIDALTARLAAATKQYDELKHVVECNKKLLIERDALTARLAVVEALLDSRAGKLLRKGKKFVVVAVDESYFHGVFHTIRYSEQQKGTWTDEDELWYREAIGEWIEAAKGGRDE